MADTSDLKKGVIINHKDELWSVEDKTLVDQARGSAIVRVELKSIEDGHIEEETFQSGAEVDIADIRHKNMQYLYRENNRFAFMDQESYETVEVDKKVIGEDEKYLKEGLEVIMKTYEGRPVAMELPSKVAYEVEEAPPAVKGDSASGNVTKTITLENGLEVEVPVFIQRGEEIFVNTETGEYSERAS